MFDTRKDTDRYLGKVYGLATVGLATAAYGAKLQMDGVIHDGFLMTLAQLGLLMGIGMTEYSARQTHKDGASPLRYAMFIAFALCAGVNVGGWIQLSLKTAFGPHYYVSINDALVYESFVLSSLLFGVFTVAGFLASPGMLFLATVAIGIGSMITFWSSLGALFGLVSLLAMETIVIRLGLVIFSAYVLVDTWVIVQQARSGVRDVVRHSITLLTDFLQLFVRILYIVAKAQKEKKKN